MRIARAFLFVFGMGLLATPPNSPTGLRWNVLHKQALAAAERGSFDEADVLLRSALRSLPKEENVAAVLLWNEIGSVHQRNGQIAEAEKDFKYALCTNRGLAMPDEGETAVALNDLATIAGARRETLQAEELLREAYRELQKMNETEGKTAALVKSNFALTFQQEGRYSEAGLLYHQALTAVKSWFGEKSIEYARTLTNLAWFQFQTGAYRKAVESGELARSIEGGLPYVSNSERALTLNNAGMALSEAGLLTQARAALLEAIDIERNMADKSQLVFSLNSLGAVEQKNGHFEEARNLELQVLALRRQGVPVEDVTLASALNTLGRIATAEHDFDEAHKRYAQACELLEKATGALRVQYAATLSNMGALETAERHYKKSEVLYRKALAIDQSQLGPNHPAVATDHSNIAAQLFYQKRRDEALELYQEARVAIEASYGPASLEMARLWRNIAVVCVAGQQFEPAVTAYEKAVRTLESFSAGKDPGLPSWLHEYAVVLRKEHHWAEAEAVETRALGMEVRNTLAAQRQTAPSAAMQQNREKTCGWPGLC